MKTTIYPNPANDVLWLSVTKTDELPLRLTVYDALGTSRQSWEVPPGQDYHHQIPVSNLPDGAYYLQLQNGQEDCMKPFIVAH
jgi:hypothetical protein